MAQYQARYSKYGQNKRNFESYRTLNSYLFEPSAIDLAGGRLYGRSDETSSPCPCSGLPRSMILR
jgi:hypothetical protein